MADFAPPWTPQQQYKFTGILNDPDEPHQQMSFYVLAGLTAPVPTGGWPKVGTIDRARRKGFTQIAGYDPASMDVAIRFEATVDYGSFGWTPSQIELNIQKLEWMAGRGKLYANGTHPAQGVPPLVQIGSYQAGASSSTNLIPPNYHSDGANDLRWVISNLQYDSSSQGCIRGSLGDRHRQDVTVSVTEYVAIPGAPKSTRQRQKGRGTTTGYKAFHTTAAVNTIAKLCVKHGINQASKWRDVVSFNQSRLRIKSYTQPLRAGTVVHIPNRDF